MRQNHDKAIVDQYGEGREPFEPRGIEKRRFAVRLEVQIGPRADPSMTDPKGRDSVAIARDRKLPAGIIEKMESLQRKLGKRRH